MTDGLRSGQVAAAAGVNQQTLRYYERRGLILEPDRTLGGHRLYPPETVRVVRVIKTAQRLGFTLGEVAELLVAAAHRHGSDDAGLHARATAKLAEIEQKIVDLGVIRDTLQSAVAAGCDDLITCTRIGLLPPTIRGARSSSARLTIPSGTGEHPSSLAFAVWRPPIGCLSSKPAQIGYGRARRRR